MAFPPRFLDDIKDRVGLADVVGRRVKLVRKGREHLGLCPFHNEKTPSFTVSEDKGFYHCFGCGASGDVISFVMEAEKLAFPDAIEQLAGMAGLEMPEQSPEERVLEAKRVGLAEAVEAAAQWFADRLRGKDGAAAREYLAQRGLDDTTIGRFRLGFAPDSRDSLKTALTGQGFDLDTLVEAGLLKRPDDGRAPYDFFRDRVIFPIADKRGRTVAFGGRLMGDAKAAKYINSPDTPLFHKGRMLYNLDRAAAAVRGGAEMVVAEGYMDVIALHRAGFEGAVAPLGTAMTEDQIIMLWRHVDEPVLCFDGDTAGGRAATRAAERALPILRPGKSLRFAMLPAGKDPDDLIAGHGAAAMRRVLDSSMPMSELVWNLELGLGSADTPERRAGLERRLWQRSQQITDRSVQDHYWSVLKEKLWLKFRSAQRKAPRRGRNAVKHQEPGGNALARTSAAPRLRHMLIAATIIAHPLLADEFSDSLSRIAFDADLDKLLQALQKQLTAQPDLDAETLKRHLSQDGFAALIEALFADDMLEFAAAARAGASVDVARRDVESTLELIFQARRMEELGATARYTAEDLNEETEAKLLAKRKDAELSESRMHEAANGFYDTGTQDNGG